MKKKKKKNCAEDVNNVDVAVNEEVNTPVEKKKKRKKKKKKSAPIPREETIQSPAIVLCNL